MAVIRIDGGLFFATAAALDERVRAVLAGEPGLYALVLDFEGVNFVDSQGAAKMSELHELTDANGVELRLARVKPDVADVLAAEGLIDRIGRDRIHGNVHRAVEAAQAVGARRPRPSVSRAGCRTSWRGTGCRLRIAVAAGQSIRINEGVNR